MEKTKESDKDRAGNNVVNEKPKGRRWCCVTPVILILLAVAGLIIYQFIPQDYSKHSPARDYQIPEPSAEAKARNIDCNQYPIFKNNPGKYKPLCINMFAATADQIDSANTNGQYDIVLLYGQYSTFEIYVPTQVRDVNNIGESFLRMAKFNDLITIPKMMEYYGLADLSFIPQQFGPYPAITYTFADQDKLYELCGGYGAGCAKPGFQTVIKNVFLAEPKDVGHLFTKDNGDEFRYTLKWPSNCYADSTIIHETAHIFLEANKIKITGMISDGWLEAPSYFNENLTEIFTNGFSDVACGAGTVEVEKLVIDGKPSSGGMVEFNASFPPAILHPTSYPKDNTCRQAIISSFSHYLVKGELKTQFKNFVIAFRDAMKQNNYKAFDDDKLMARFMLKMLNNDPSEKEFLNSHACGI